MSNIKAKYLNASLLLLGATLLAICLCAGIVWAALSTTFTKENANIGIAELSSEVKSGSIEVTNGVDCVMRVAPLNQDVKSSLNTDTTNWTAQYNGWYYYNSIISANSNPTISVTNASSGNIVVELMQANYATETVTVDQNQVQAPTGGFIIEWGPWNFSENNRYLSTSVTTDGISLGIFNGSYVAAFYGNNTIGSTSVSTGNSQVNYSLQVSNNKVQVNTSSTSTPSWEDIQSDVRLYNNSTVPLVMSFSIVIGKGVEGVTADMFSSVITGDWNYNQSLGQFVCKTAVLPGQYITIFDASNNNASNISGTVPFSLNVSVVDSVSYHLNYNTSTNDPYLKWLDGLDTSADNIYYTQYVNKVNSGDNSIGN